VIRQEISDEAWEWIEPLLPDRSPQRGGRWRDHRTMLEAMVWRFRTGAPWRDLPERFGPWQTVYDRFNRWCADGTFDRLHARALSEADARGEIDWQVSVDSTAARVHQHGATLRRLAGNAATAKPTPAEAEPTENEAEPTENEAEPTENEAEPTENEAVADREDVVAVAGGDTGGPSGIFG
jgi:transposase